MSLSLKMTKSQFPASTCAIYMG